MEPLPVRHKSPINVEGTDKEGPLARYGVLQRVTVMYGAVPIKVSSVDPYYFPCARVSNNRALLLLTLGISYCLFQIVTIVDYRFYTNVLTCIIAYKDLFHPL